jgi:hypothetical protein
LIALCVIAIVLDLLRLLGGRILLNIVGIGVLAMLITNRRRILTYWRTGE